MKRPCLFLILSFPLHENCFTNEQAAFQFWQGVLDHAGHLPFFHRCGVSGHVCVASHEHGAKLE